MEKPPFNHARCSECDAVFLTDEVSSTRPERDEPVDSGWMPDLET